MAKINALTIDIASDLFLASGAWGTVREISAMNAADIAAERRRYMALASEGF